VVIFRYWVGLRDLGYGHPEKGINIHRYALEVLLNGQHASNMHAKKQLVNSEYVFPNLLCYQMFLF